MPILALTLAIALAAAPECPLEGLRAHLALPPESRPSIVDEPFATVPLSREDSERAAILLWRDRLAHTRAVASDAWAEGRVVLGDDAMRLLLRRFGVAPDGRRSLYISLHGGGGAPSHVNDQQWRNQIRLYRPDEGIVVAPRALQDTWDLWHEPRIDRFIARIVECAVAFEGVDPDRVYLLGYSAGGDGLYRLAPRLADRLAAASMMAGHPGDADPRSLRNLPFSIQMGELDHAYERNARARAWGERLVELQAADLGGYPHLVQIHAGLGHWMELRDAAAIEWMSRFVRRPWPRRVVWHQHAVTHANFYWLGVEDADRRPNTTIVAERSDDPAANAIEILEADVNSVTIWLHDALLDLDRPVTVLRRGQPVYEGDADRTIAVLAESLESRGDPGLMAAARIRVNLGKDVNTDR